ncbi:MAG: DNA translocase FtsK [Oscillospiraceae bacterium]
MAQKKGTGTKKSSSSAKINKKSAHDSGKTPRRREIWSLTLLILGVFSILGYFKSDGVFINFYSGFMKGLFGYGFYILPPALLFSSYMLGFHHGKPVRFRVFSTLLIPMVFGALFQLLFTDSSYRLSLDMFKSLWTNGTAMKSAGVFSGSILALFCYLFSKIGAGIVFGAGLVFLVLSALNQTIGNIAKKYKNRERLKYEPEPEPENEPAKSKKQSEPFRDERKIKKVVPAFESEKPVRPDIDIPLDDPIDEKPAPKGGLTPPLFNRKPRVITPDQVISGAVETIEPKTQEIPAPAPAPAAPTAQAPSEPTKKEATPEETFSPDEVKMTTPGAPEYVFPPITLLSAEKSGGRVDGREEVRMNKERLEAALQSFGINSPVSSITRGPSVTRYETELEAGVKLNKLTNLADDIALSLGASGVRIAAIPNKISTVGIEVPNKLISKVYLREIVDSPEFKNAPSKLTFAIGKNISGEAIVGNIAKLPHLLVAGTTGSGKSVCLNSLILSILYKARPDEVKLIMVDPKMVEFKMYNGIPHLLVPVVTEAKKAAGALQWAVTEMMKRYRLFSDTGARDLLSYNETVRKSEEGEVLPQIVVVIDELADLMLIAAKEVEESVCRVAQMGRAAGVHLVIATQSPRADVITGLMKANIPSRIAFKVSSSLESRIILDAGGNADKLVGNGDMLYAPIGTSKPIRVQGTWVTDEEREDILSFIKKSGEANYSDEVISQIEKASESGGNGKAEEKSAQDNDCDELLPQAVDVIFETGQASVSMLQRRLKLGYSRAARLVDQMEERGIVGPFEGSKPRQMLITKAQWQEMQYIHKTAPADSTVAQDYAAVSAMFPPDASAENDN